MSFLTRFLISTLFFPITSLASSLGNTAFDAGNANATYSEDAQLAKPTESIDLSEISIYSLNNTLYFKGEITDSTILIAMNVINNYRGKITTMVVTSPGGDTVPAMRLGYWIFDNHINLIVDKVCLSSCANYFFTAASSVYIKSGAIVFWHGGSTQKSLQPVNGSLKELEVRRHKIDLESRFFEHIHVKQDITVYGQLNDSYLLYNTPSCIQAIDKGELQGWTYTIEDLKKFGVNDVVSDNDLHQVDWTLC
ncbi:hypothetical protein MCX36_07955 [Vibrio aestuarianus]|uniref:hypothetical protein n=1 Tax=Vibrio aestuarianus TaxID=28171 RepID=UPI00237C72C3|nr:hypothetical protein [Vibrio aestuarianus]MDE1310367.1 hypothetical protein [Vibrio aestuarianus]